MKTVAVVQFRSNIRRSQEVLAMTNLIPNGSEFVHFHDPRRFKTKFYTWFVQIKKRYELPNLKCSKFKLNKDKEPLNGKGGRAKVPLPPDNYIIWST